MTPQQHERLVEEAVQGNEAALTVLLKHSAAVLTRQVARRISAPFATLISADDIVQEAHVEVVQRIGTFAPRGSGSFERWVTTIALRRLRTVLRQHRTLKRGGAAGVRRQEPHDSDSPPFAGIADPGLTPSRIVARRQAVGAMEQALEKIPAHYRDAIRMVHIEGRSIRDAALKLNCSERSVHGLVRRGMEHLRAAMGPVSDYLTYDG